MNRRICSLGGQRYRPIVILVISILATGCASKPVADNVRSSASSAGQDIQPNSTFRTMNEKEHSENVELMKRVSETIEHKK